MNFDEIITSAFDSFGHIFPRIGSYQPNDPSIVWKKQTAVVEKGGKYCLIYAFASNTIMTPEFTSALDAKIKKWSSENNCEFGIGTCGLMTGFSVVQCGDSGDYKTELDILYRLAYTGGEFGGRTPVHYGDKEFSFGVYNDERMQLQQLSIAYDCSKNGITDFSSTEFCKKFSLPNNISIRAKCDGIFFKSEHEVNIATSAYTTGELPKYQNKIIISSRSYEDEPTGLMIHITPPAASHSYHLDLVGFSDQTRFHFFSTSDNNENSLFYEASRPNAKDSSYQRVTDFIADKHKPRKYGSILITKDGKPMGDDQNASLTISGFRSVFEDAEHLKLHEPLLIDSIIDTMKRNKLFLLEINASHATGYAKVTRDIIGIDKEAAKELLGDSADKINTNSVKRSRLFFDLIIAAIENKIKVFIAITNRDITSEQIKTMINKFNDHNSLGGALQLMKLMAQEHPPIMFDFLNGFTKSDKHGQRLHDYIKNVHDGK